MFEDTGTLLLWAISTYILVRIIFTIHFSVKSSADELHAQLLKRLDEIVHRVKVEKQADIYYWFDEDNNRFLGQGKSDEEIIDVIKKRFPEHIFYFESTNQIVCAKHNWIPQSTNKSQ